jgi:hypothetical protein
MLHHADITANIGMQKALINVPWQNRMRKHLLHLTLDLAEVRVSRGDDCLGCCLHICLGAGLPRLTLAHFSHENDQVFPISVHVAELMLWTSATLLPNHSMFKGTTLYTLSHSFDTVCTSNDSLDLGPDARGFKWTGSDWCSLRLASLAAPRRQNESWLPVAPSMLKEPVFTAFLGLLFRYCILRVWNLNGSCCSIRTATY